MPSERARSRHQSPRDAEASGLASAGLWDHLRTLVRHRWWALGGFLVLAVPMVAITLLTTPVYFSAARLMISDQGNTEVTLSDRSRRPEDKNSDPRTQAEVVRSRALAKATIEAMKLWEVPEFAPMAAGAADDAARAQALVDPFLGHLAVTLVEDSGLLSIGFEAQDPDVAARGANMAARTYIERDRESRFQSANSSAEWFENRLKEQREEVSRREAALQAYRERQDALALNDRQNIVVSRLNELSSEVTRARTNRLMKEAPFRQIQAIKNDPAALETHPLIASNAFVQTLKAQAAELARQDAQLAERLGPKHPDRIQVSTALSTVQERLRAEVDKVVSGVETDYQAALAQESSLNAALNTQKSEAGALDRKGVEYAALEREAVSARQVFDTLLQQTKAAALSTDIKQTNIRVVDLAEPSGVPVRPRKGQGLLAALMLGLLGAAAGAFGREYMRREVQSPDDLERRLGLPVLALVPPAEAGEAEHVGGLSPRPTEAIRRLRANVMLTAGNERQPGNVLVVTSAAPREGKSFVSSHLASSMAAVDQRVVLIDADMRRPRLHTMFDRQRAPGLADVLLGRRSTAEVLRPVGPSGLVLIPSGIPTSQASELLSLNAFRAFIDGLRSDFDWIIIDSPPVMAVADASVLARDASGVLFVTSAEHTSLEAAETALHELHAVGAHIVGAVLNRAPVTRESFYYSRYYRPEYDVYMSKSDESVAEGAPAQTS